MTLHEHRSRIQKTRTVAIDFELYHVFRYGHFFRDHKNTKTPCETTKPRGEITKPRSQEHDAIVLKCNERERY